LGDVSTKRETWRSARLSISDPPSLSQGREEKEKRT
jgi:hypothetical protein